MKKLIVFLLALCLFYSCKKDGSGPNDQLIYREDFNEKETTGFWIGTKNNDSIQAALQDGKYLILNQCKTAGKWQTFSLNPVFLVDTGDVAIETSLSVSPLNGADQAYAGLVWGVDHTTHQVFLFGYFADGYYDLWGFPNGNSFKQYVAAKPETALKKNGFNKLRIEKRGKTLHFLINGKEVYSMPSNITTLDRPGVVADIHTRAEFDYFKAESIH